MDAIQTRTVLIVDDDIAVVEYLRKVVEQAGYVVNSASDLETGQALLSRSPIVVFVDLRLQQESGIALIERATSLEPRPRIVAISGAGAAALEEATRCGADRVLDKPFSPQLIIACLAELIDGDDPVSIDHHKSNQH